MSMISIFRFSLRILKYKKKLTVENVFFIIIFLKVE